jgi:hypothetical protein
MFHVQEALGSILSMEASYSDILKPSSQMTE